MASTAPTGFGAVRVEIKSVESFVGKDDGKTRYMSFVEFPSCPGSRWPSVRCTVLADTPFSAGVFWLCVKVYDGKKGEARASIIGRAD